MNAKFSPPTREEGHWVSYVNSADKRALTGALERLVRGFERTCLSRVERGILSRMHSNERERIHVVINTHNRLLLIRQTIPRILSATVSDDSLTITHSVYDDESDKGTRDYLLSLLAARKIDNLILGSGELSEYRVVAQTNNPCIANYLQVLRACLFVAPASWVLHFTDDALIRFTGLNSRWLQGWVSIMRAEPRIISIQMTDYDVNLLDSLSGVNVGLPPSARIHRTNFVSDRYTLYFPGLCTRRRSERRPSLG